MLHAHMTHPCPGYGKDPPDKKRPGARLRKDCGADALSESFSFSHLAEARMRVAAFYIELQKVRMDVFESNELIERKYILCKLSRVLSNY